MKSKDWKLSLWERTPASPFHFGILPCLSILKPSIWKRMTPTLKTMNCKTLIPKFALVVLALSAPAALSQEEILIITGKRMDKTVSYQISPNARELDFSDNRLTSLILPGGLTNLEDLNLDGNQLTSFTLPAGLTSLKDLDLDNNQLTSFILPEGLTSLEHLYLDNNQLTSLTLPEDLASLKDLTLATNQLTSLNLPENLSVWRWLDLSDNQLTSLTLPEGLTNLAVLDLENNRLASLTLPKGLTDLGSLDLSGNRLTSLAFPAGMRLRELDLRNNPIEQLLVPEGMDIENLRIEGISKENIIRYVPDSVLPSLVIRREEDGRVAIVFSGGVLQAADNLFSGDWEDISNAVSLFYINPAKASQKFFRVRSAR